MSYYRGMAMPDVEIRDCGYYWVKCSIIGWTIAKWNGFGWDTFEWNKGKSHWEEIGNKIEK